VEVLGDVVLRLGVDAHDAEEELDNAHFGVDEDQEVLSLQVQGLSEEDAAEQL